MVVIHDAERSQLRLEARRGKLRCALLGWLRLSSGLVELDEALGKLWDALEPLAVAQLPPLGGDYDCVLDIFYYPRSLGTGCPAHVDPGLLTLVLADGPGLQAQTLGGWVEVGPLTALAGSEWAARGLAPTPCVHRVELQQERASAAMELRTKGSSMGRGRTGPRWPREPSMRR